MDKHAAKWKNILLAGAAAVLVLCGATGRSMAYFTTYVTAAGSRTVQVQMTVPGLREEFEGNTKVITASNDGERACYVRVAWFAPLDCSAAGDAWQDGGDGYWYYASPLEPGKAAGALRVTPVIPAGATEDFNIIVTVESAPVLYNADGTPMANGPAYAGWSLQAKAPRPVTGNP